MGGHAERGLRKICMILFIVFIFYALLNYQSPTKYPVDLFYSSISSSVSSNHFSGPVHCRSRGVTRRRHCTSKIVLASCRLINHTTCALFLLYLSGDLELNPGPARECRSLRTRCTICKRALKNNRPLVNCSLCALPFHLGCIGPQFETSRRCPSCAPVSVDTEDNSTECFHDFPELKRLADHRGLKFLHLNVCSLLPKVDELRLLFEHYKGFDIFSVTETHLSSNVSDSEISINGYTLYRRDRQSHSKGGGVVVYVKDSLLVSRRTDLESTNVEGVWLEIFITKSRNILLGSLYRPPVGSQHLSNNFNVELEESINLAASESKEILLIGDLNANFLPRQRLDSHSRDLKDMLTKNFGMSQLIDQPTRITQNTSTLIDVVLSTHPHNIPFSSVIKLGISDHYMIGCARKLNSLKFKPRTVKHRNYSKYNQQEFVEDLKSGSWVQVFLSSTVDDAWNNFKNIFLTFCDRHAPIIIKKIRGCHNPWLTTNISKLINKRDYCLKKAKSSGHDVDWSRYRSYRNQVNSEIRRAKAEYNRTLIQENMDNPKNFWKTIKKILPSNSSKSESINQLKCDGQQITDKVLVANSFCKFFSNVKSRISQALVSGYSVIPSVSSKLTNHEFHLSDISNTFVFKQLSQLKASKATGLDGIPARLLKDSASFISPMITHIVNLSIKSQSVPQEWKHAKVVPLFKDGARDDMDNYRPISILPILSKILERAVQFQLVEFLETHKLFSKFQCGFRRNHSTQSAITFLTDTIRRNIDDGCITGAIFVDFRKAFDTIDHKMLLYKLGMFGICGNELQWFENYLSNRMQSVFTGGVLSNPQPLISGVPQGSILGPLLFSLYVTDLPDCLHNSEVLMYADDTVIYYSASDTSQLIRVLNEELKLLESWSKKNDLYIHRKKTEYVLFGTHQKLNQYDFDTMSDIYLGDQILNRKPYYKYLGIYLDQTLSFNEHFTRLINKVSSQLAMLSRIRNNLTVYACEKVFSTMIMPKLDYCDFVWNTNLPQSKYHRLEGLQKRAAKIILQDNSLDLKGLLNQLGWKSINARSSIHKLIFVFKCLNSLGPNFFHNCFSKSDHIHNTRRNGKDLIIPKVRTESARKSCFFSGATLYNSLPSSLKEVNSLLIFKSKLKEFFS